MYPRLEVGRCTQALECDDDEEGEEHERERHEERLVEGAAAVAHHVAALLDADVEFRRMGTAHSRVRLCTRPFVWLELHASGVR